jgi:hypothetical protein
MVSLMKYNKEKQGSGQLNPTFRLMVAKRPDQPPDRPKKSAHENK